MSQQNKKPSQITVIGTGRNTCPKDQVDIVITITDHSSGATPAASAAVIDSVRKIINNIQGNLTTALGGNSNIDVSFVAPFGIPDVHTHYGTESVKEGGFFSSSVSVDVITGFKCTWGIQVSATLSDIGRVELKTDSARNIAIADFTAKMIEAVDKLPSARGAIVSASPSSDPNKKASMTNFSIKYSVSDKSRKIKINEAREKAFEDAKRRAESIVSAQGFGLDANVVLVGRNIVNVTENVDDGSSNSNNDGLSSIYPHQQQQQSMFKKVKKTNNAGKVPRRNGGLTPTETESISVSVAITYQLPASTAGSEDQNQQNFTIVSFDATGSAPLKRTTSTLTMTLSGGNDIEHPVTATVALQQLRAAQAKFSAALTTAATAANDTIKIEFAALPRFLHINDTEKKNTFGTSFFSTSASVTVTLSNSSPEAVARCVDSIRRISSSIHALPTIENFVAGPDMLDDNDNLNDAVAESAARQNAIAEAKSLAADYGRRLGLELVGVHEFEETGDNVSFGGTKTAGFSSLGAGFDQAQQQQKSSSSGSNSLSSFSKNYYDVATQVEGTQTELNWSGSVAFKFR